MAEVVNIRLRTSPLGGPWLTAIPIVCGVAACTPSSPPPDAAPPVGPTDQRIYSILVEAGCLAPSAGNPAAVAGERAQWHDMGLDCLADGGTIQSCHVPCGDR